MRICPTCGAKSKWPSGRCNRCENRVRRVKERQRKGLCSKCGEREPSEGYAECLPCRQRYREQRDRRFQARLKNGRCTWCGGPNAIVHHVQQSFCCKCWFKQQAARYHISYKLLSVLWAEQRGLCAYSGEPMTLGGQLARSASIDHKTPRSRGGTNAKSNLQWVSRKMNLMKNNLTHAEFVELCSRVHFQFATNV